MEAELRLGRYRLFEAIAAGGIGAVHLGRMQTDAGFWRTVAIKRLHPQYARSQDMIASLVDEARIASRIRHTNVVPTLDAIVEGGETLLVMEYVPGESLANLLRVAKNTLPIGVVSAIVSGALLGLHAAHEATDDRGRSIGLVHRDVSPQNILVGTDGVARVLDFGIAKSRGRLVETTSEGALKGKLAYMAPEQFMGAEVDRRTDVFAAGIVLWEALSGRRLFRGKTEAEVLAAILNPERLPPSTHRPDCPPELDEVVMKALAQRPEHRYATARDFARALELVVPAASAETVREIVELTAGSDLAERAEKVRKVEALTTPSVAPPPAESGPGAAAPQAPPSPLDRDAVTMTSVGASAVADLLPPPPLDTRIPEVTAPEPKPRRGRMLLWLGAPALVAVLALGLWSSGVMGALGPRAAAPSAEATESVGSEPSGAPTLTNGPVITMAASSEPSVTVSSAIATPSVAPSASAWAKPLQPPRNPGTVPTPPSVTAPASSAPRCFKVKKPDGSWGLNCPSG